MLLGLTTLFGLTALSLPIVWYLFAPAGAGEGGWREVLVRVERDRFDQDSFGCPSGRLQGRLVVAEAATHVR